MFGFALRLILGVIFFFLSTPGGMAHEAVLEEARAEVFLTQDFDDEDRQAFSFNEAVLSLGGGNAVETAGAVKNAKQAKRNHKRTPSHFKSISQFHFSKSISPKAQARGVARRPATQDSRQERTKTIRFLQICALIG